MLGALATLPLCIFVYASYRAEIGQLRTDAEATQRREAAHAARTVDDRLQALASQLLLIDRLKEGNASPLPLPDAGLVGLVDARKLSGAISSRLLSAFSVEKDEVTAFLSVPRPDAAAGGPAGITGKILPARLVAYAATPGDPGGVRLADQEGRLVPSAAGGVERLDLARLRSLPTVAPIAGGWFVVVAARDQELAAREGAVTRRFLVGGALAFLTGLLLLHFVAQRLRSEIDDVVSDFGELDGQGPNSVISEFAEIGGALASARAKAGRTARELEQAKHDAVTGLPGRELFLQRAQEQVDAARMMDDCGVALLYIDLDGFKAVNDTRGHKAGDEILKKVAATLRQCVRSPDAVGRTGGDEFVICFAAPRHNLQDLATRACDRISEGVSALGPDIGCSIGWATSGGHCDLLELIEEADAAMYLAKTARRHQKRVAAQTSGEDKADA